MLFLNNTIYILVYSEAYDMSHDIGTQQIYIDVDMPF